MPTYHPSFSGCNDLGLTADGSYLEDTLGIGGHGGMQWRAPHVVLDIGVCTGLQEPLGSIGTGVAGGQVQGGLSSAVCLVVQVGSLVDEVGDHAGRGLLVLLAVGRLQAPAAAGRDHQRGEAVCMGRGERHQGSEGRTDTLGAGGTSPSTGTNYRMFEPFVFVQLCWIF